MQDCAPTLLQFSAGAVLNPQGEIAIAPVPSKPPRCAVFLQHEVHALPQTIKVGPYFLRMDVIPHQRCGNTIEVIALGQTKPEVVILKTGERFIKHSCFLEALSPEQHGGGPSNTIVSRKFLR